MCGSISIVSAAKPEKMENAITTAYQIADVNVDVFSKTKFPRIALMSRSYFGRNEAIKTICHALKGQFYQVFVHAISESADKFFETFIPSNRISSKRNFNQLRKMYSEHIKRKKLYEAKVALGKMSIDEAQKECQMLVILDDLVFLGDLVFYDDLIKQIWMNGCHDWITVMVTLHSPDAGGPIVRDRSDWVVTWYDPSETSQKRFYKNWTSHFPSFRAFKEIYKETSSGQKCMVACKSGGGGRDIEDNIFFWKPTKIEGAFTFLQ